MGVSMSGRAQGSGVSAPGPGHVSLDSGLAPSQAHCQLQFGKKAQQILGWTDRGTASEMHRCSNAHGRWSEGKGHRAGWGSTDTLSISVGSQACGALSSGAGAELGPSPPACPSPPPPPPRQTS